MKKRTHYLFLIVLICILAFNFQSCKKKKLFQDPEIEPLRHGIQISAALGYCASLANSLFKNQALPPNVLFTASNNPDFSGSGIMYVDIDDTYPLPFNGNVGQIVIACLWNENYDQAEHTGVMTALFTDVSILENKYEFVGIRTVPVINDDKGRVVTVFAEQDIVLGEGSDTLINLSLSNPEFNVEVSRADATQPSNVFVAVTQNVWYISVDQNDTYYDIYDDEVTINGGGQIVGVESETGGILYHALIGAKYRMNECDQNPTSGVGFIQNLKAGDKTDLGTIVLNFHEDCNGKAFVEAGTGKYLSASRRTVKLNLY
jgi:hypothetical protein